MRKLLVATVFAGLVAVASAGCGQSVDAVRAEALSRVAGMLYLDDPRAVRESLEDATTTEEIEKLVGKAVREDQERAEAYWSCAGKAPDALSGSEWAVDARRGDLDVDKVVLRLEEGGVAELVTVDSITLFKSSSPPPPTKMDSWLVENAGKVTGWSSDAAELVASRTLVDGTPPSFSPINKSCHVKFTLTLTTSEGESQFPSTLELSSHHSLIIDGKGTSQKEG